MKNVGLAMVETHADKTRRPMYRHTISYDSMTSVGQLEGKTKFVNNAVRVIAKHFAAASLAQRNTSFLLQPFSCSRNLSF
jgi:hypothetical protein